MDPRAVLVFLCLLAAPAACRPLSDASDVNQTIEVIRSDAAAALTSIADLPLPPGPSCLLLDASDLGEEKDKNLTARQLSSFRCYMKKTVDAINNTTNVTPDLVKHLRNICQNIQNIEDRARVEQACTLPDLDESIILYTYVKCLMELLTKRLTAHLII